MGNLFTVKNWIKEFLFPYDYCKSLKHFGSPEEKTGLHILKTRKNRIHAVQDLSINRLDESSLFSRFKYSFFSPVLFVESVKIKARKKTMLDFVVRRHIKKMNLFEEEFNFCYDVLSFDGKSAEVNLYALSSTDSNSLLKDVEYSKKAITCFVPLESVITELVHDVTPNPVVSLWVENQQILVLATKGKKILSRGSYKHDGKKTDFFQWLIDNKYVQNALDMVKQQEPSQDVSLLIWGESYRILQNRLHKHFLINVDKTLEYNIHNKLKWKKSFKHISKEPLVQTETVVKNSKRQNQSYTDLNVDDVFSNPALFGLAICKKSNNFISSTYDITYSKFVYSHYALIASLALFFVFSGLNLKELSTQSETESKLEQDISALNVGVQLIKPRIPGEKILENVLEKAKFKQTLYSELNVINFLGWITNITPEKAFIDQLLIELVGDGQTAKVVKTKRHLLEAKNKSKKYTVELRVVINRAYSDSVTHIDTFFEKLNEKVTSPQSKFIYLNKDDKIPSALVLSFIVDPARFF